MLRHGIGLEECEAMSDLESERGPEGLGLWLGSVKVCNGSGSRQCIASLHTHVASVAEEAAGTAGLGKQAGY